MEELLPLLLRRRRRHNHFHPIPPGAAELILPKLGKSKLFLGTLRRTSFAVEEEAEEEGEGSFPLLPLLCLFCSFRVNQI